MLLPMIKLFVSNIKGCLSWNSHGICGPFFTPCMNFELYLQYKKCKGAWKASTNRVAIYNLSGISCWNRCLRKHFCMKNQTETTTIQLKYTTLSRERILFIFLTPYQGSKNVFAWLRQRYKGKASISFLRDVCPVAKPLTPWIYFSPHRNWKKCDQIRT